MDAAIMVSAAIGYWLGGQLFAKFGYVTVYVVALTCHVIAFLYGVFYLKESRLKRLEPDVKPEKEQEKPEKKEEPPQKSKTKLYHIFRLRNLVESFSVLTHKRANGLRHVVVLMVLLFGASSIVRAGTGIVSMTYARKKFT
jgi:Ca2+/Na+ antiporter